MEATTLRRVEWRQLFPWLYLFGAFRVAIDPRKLILAILGLCFVSGGNHAIDAIGLRTDLIEEASPAPRHAYPWSISAGSLETMGVEPLSILSAPGAFTQIFGNWDTLIYPVLHGALHPAFVLANSPAHGFAASVDALLRLLWFAFVWSIFGGAISRMTVYQFIKDEKLGVVAGLKFSCGKLAQLFSAPLLPLGGTFLLLLMCAAIGALARIPGAGPVLMAILMGVSLLFSIAIIIMLIGVGAGWPLMVSAISTEDSDGFDGFSRAHSYIFDVPWHYLWCFVLAMIYASATGVFVDSAASWSYQSAKIGMSWGSGGESLAASNELAILVINFWDSLWLSLVVGYRASLFWVLFLLIYLVLRNASDRIPMNEAFLEPLQEGQQRAMALGGIADVKEVVSERPIVNPEEEPQETEANANLDSEDVSDEQVDS